MDTLFVAIIYTITGGAFGFVVGIASMTALWQHLRGDGAWLVQLYHVIILTLAGAGWGLYSALKTGGAI